VPRTPQDAAFPPRFEDLPALRELSLRQLNLLEAAPPVTGLSALRRISLQARCENYWLMR